MSKKGRQYILVSFFVTNPLTLKKLEYQWGLRTYEHSKVIGRSKELSEKVRASDFGGSVALIDASDLSKDIIYEIASPVATALCYDNKRKELYVGSDKNIKVIFKGRVKEVINNNLFNDIHEISIRKANKLMVVSTGVDGILEIDRNSLDVDWDWLATENGYESDPVGKRRLIDRNFNYQRVSTITPQHTTHLNSCLITKEGNILSTFFHQGQLVEINHSSKKVRILLDGLKCPHFIRKINQGYLLSDTRNDRILILDNNFKIIRIIKDNYNWVHDCIELDNGDLLIADSNNNRIIRTDKDLNLIGSINLVGRKLFKFLPIEEKEIVNVFGKSVKEMEQENHQKQMDELNSALKSKDITSLEGGSLSKIFAYQDIVVKSYSGPYLRGYEKLKKEVNYIESLSEDLKPYFPSILAKKDEKNLFAFSIKYYKNLNSITDILMNNLYDKEKAWQILEKILFLLESKMYNEKLGNVTSNAYVRTAHYNRVYGALDKLSKIPKYNKIISGNITLNGEKLPDLMSNLNKITSDPKTNRLLSPKILTKFHGNFHFANIMTSSDTLKGAVS